MQGPAPSSPSCDPHVLDTPAVRVFSCAPWHAELAALAAAHAAAPPRDPAAWLTRIAALRTGLPAPLRDAVAALRGRETAAVLLRELPIDPQLPPTPLDSRRAPKSTCYGEFFLALLGGELGEGFAYRQLHGGELFHDIAPVYSEAAAPSGECSRHALRMHTDGATLPFAPDYLLLWCNRGDEAAATSIFPLAALLDHAEPELLAALQAPQFRHVPDYEFEVECARAPGPAVPLLWREGDDWRLRFDPDFLVDAVGGAAQAARRAEALLERNAVTLTLRAGDVLAFDNRRVAHARDAFAPRFDGTDRWLQCLYVATTLPQSGPDLAMTRREIDFPRWRMATTTTVADDVIGHVRTVTGRDGVIEVDTALRDDLGVDSFMLVDLTLALEQAFGIELSDAAMLDARSIADVVRAIDLARRGQAVTA